MNLEMKLVVVNVSVVFAGQNYSPMLFTPEFLTKARIKKKGWELIEQPVISPLLVILKYNNGMTFSVDLNRIQVIDGDPPADLNKLEVGSLAEKVLSYIPQVRHTAVGINIAALIEHDNAAHYLREKFIKDGPWIEPDIKEVNVAIAYTRPTSILNLTFGVGTAQLKNEEQQRSGIIIAGNYHTSIDLKLTLTGSVREAKVAVESIPEKVNDFFGVVSRTFEGVIIEHKSQTFE